MRSRKGAKGGAHGTKNPFIIKERFGANPRFTPHTLAVCTWWDAFFALPIIMEVDGIGDWGPPRLAKLSWSVWGQDTSVTCICEVYTMASK